MNLDLRPLALPAAPCGEKTLLIAGPCSAETEAQVMQTARELADFGVRIFRAGIWKPRTKPGGFEGKGLEALPWLRRVNEELGRERNLVIDHRLKDFTPVTHIKGEVNREGLRRMTPREWARLQGFPDDFIIEVSDASAYKQFGNSVAIPAIQATAMEIIKRIDLSKSTSYAIKRK